MRDIDSGHKLWTPGERTEGPLAWTVAETLGFGQALLQSGTRRLNENIQLS
jgi:hypothetical protein